ncbi:uncharacterized protein LOC100202164 isoform X2 [Hydra vulgaris]|uniref:uncharacterized protein LOC100202164 isoform X2 n=1 Tax=Hydra vulgaris TaxID=6087 RepID=UPI0002B4B004|nr:uncharacterized protein LOC100202164 isoform X2 [Hydra vulgaris]
MDWKVLLFFLVVVYAVEVKEENSHGLDQADLPISQLFSDKRSTVAEPDNKEKILRRDRRGFRSYFYNYLDEIAMSICASIPSEGPGLLYAVRRTCGEKSTCKDICTDPKLRKQGPKEVQSLIWACSESLHVYKRQPSLADNYEDYTDSHKLGLAIYRHYSCTIGGCGPNYCCCRAA